MLALVDSGATHILVGPYNVEQLVTVHIILITYSEERERLERLPAAISHHAAGCGLGGASSRTRTRLIAAGCRGKMMRFAALNRQESSGDSLLVSPAGKRGKPTREAQVS